MRPGTVQRNQPVSIVRVDDSCRDESFKDGHTVGDCDANDC